MSLRIHHRLPASGRRPVSTLLTCLLLGFSAASWAADGHQASAPNIPLLERLRATGSLGSEPQQLAKAGLEQLIKGRYPDASRTFNSALQLSPSNSYLQLLNGLAYHLMASDGDGEKYALADQGYQLAVQFDGSNWLARYFLGNLRLDRRQYKEAQSAFAEALLYAESDREILYQLATASYYAGDPTTAAAALGRLEAMDPNQPKVHRAMAIVMAALGRSTEADNYLRRYRAAETDARAANRLTERLRGWVRFHQSAAGAEPLKVQFTPGGAPPAVPQAADVPAGIPLDPAAQGLPPIDPAAQGQPPIDPAALAQQPGVPGQLPPDPAAAQATSLANLAASGERMVLVDVVILRTEDLISTRKGFNLLSGLSLQFGSATAPAISFASSKVNDPTAHTNTITRAITIPALTYTLNIANSNSDSNEILARPTIAALEGVKSEFFSGTSLSAAAVGGGTGGGTVQVDKEIGVKLAITPTFLENDRIKMEIIAERTFLKAPSADVSFSFKLETSKTTVNAQTVLKFGETLILSGLSEKETNRSRDGVPLLQDVPLLQYIFSRADTRDFQRSVLILVTPRRAEYVYKADRTGKGAVVGSADSESLSELRARYTDWFKPYPNLASVFHHLGSSALYREFRTGDVTLERWEKQATLQERLHQVVDFLYY